MPAGQPLRGLVGQSMAAKKSHIGASIQLINATTVTSGSGSLTATRPCQALIYGIGAGGSGGASGGQGSGGGGAGAFFKRFRLAIGQSISYSVGAGGAAASGTDGFDGGDTTVTLPNGLVMRGGGGKGGLQGPAHLGGVGADASGGDINRSGGAGGSSTPVSDGISAGIGGGAGGLSGAGGGGGGGGAGFSDIFASGPTGGAGSAGTTNSATGGDYGGGSGGSNASGAGGRGVVMILMLRVL